MSNGLVGLLASICNIITCGRLVHKSKVEYSQMDVNKPTKTLDSNNVLNALQRPMVPLKKSTNIQTGMCHGNCR